MSCPGDQCFTSSIFLEGKSDITKIRVEIKIQYRKVAYLVKYIIGNKKCISERRAEKATLHDHHMLPLKRS